MRWDENRTAAEGLEKQLGLRYAYARTQHKDLTRKNGPAGGRVPIWRKRQ